MKKHLLTICGITALSVFLLSTKIKAQNVGISETIITPHSTSILELRSDDKGLLVPRVALTQTSSNAPVGAGIANSLLVYNTATINDVTPGFYYWDNTQWVRIVSGTMPSTGWALTGNGGTNPAVNFVGTTGAQDLAFRTNNNEHMRITSGGFAGIGTPTPGSKLTVVRTTVNTATETTGSFGVTWSNSMTHAYALSGNASKTTAETSGRSTGVYARGGNATNQWNTGLSAVLSGTNHGSAILAGTYDDYITYGFGGTFQAQYVNPAGNWGIVSYSPVYFHQSHYVMGNMGIGTSAPTTQLHTTGGVRHAGIAGTGNYLSIDANGNLSRTTGVGGSNWLVNGANVYRSGGFVGIGTATQISDLDIYQSGGAASNEQSGGINLRSYDNLYHWRIYNSHDYVRFNYSNNSGATYVSKAYVSSVDGAWIQLSDMSLKTNMENIDEVLENVLKIDILKYNYIDNKPGAPKVIGASANQLALLFPEIVSGEEGEELLGIDYSKFGVLAIKAIQEQQQIIESLEERIENQEQRIERLEQLLLEKK